MENTETLPQRIVDRKIIILKSRLNPDEVKLLGDQKKTDLFPKSGFHRPNPLDISLIGFNKFYEPLVIIGGKYSIDYCKKHFFELKADRQVKKIFVAGEEYKFKPSDDGKPYGVLKIAGEEHAHYENETYYVLDRLMREFSIEEVHMAPFETIEDTETFPFDFKKVSFTLDDEIEFLRSRIVKRPSNAEIIIREAFEITERMIIYNPIYELAFQNMKTAKMVTALIDGITGRIDVVKIETKMEQPKETPKDLSAKYVMKERSESPREIQKNEPVDNSSDSNKILNNSIPNVALQQEKSKSDAVKIKFKPEDALDLAKDLLKRLGFKNKITPIKVLPDEQDNELYIVELSLQDKTAKISVNTKTKEVKEYEIQESNSYS
jgi:hypothetical protein